MSKLVRNFIFVGIVLFVIMLTSFLVFIHPYQPYAKILLYHSVSDQNDNRDSTAISIDLFKRQMDYLSKHNYQPVFLDTIIQRYEEGKKVPAKWVVITFDAWYDDFYHNVYPILKRYNFKATLFVITSSIEEGGVAWEQLRQMKDSGLVEIGSHSHEHLSAFCSSLSEVNNDIVKSKAVLEKKLRVKSLVYAYPYGALNGQVRELVERAGYKGAVGITYRRGEFKLNDIYNLRRIYVSGDSRFPLVFRFMLSGYYVPIRGLALRLLNIKAPRDAYNCS